MHQLKIYILLLFVSFFSTVISSSNPSLNIDSCKFCKQVVHSVQIPIINNKIYFTPVVAWNNYDKTQIGIAFYAKPKLNNIDFVFLPMLGTGSLNLTGVASFRYRFNLEKIKHLDIGLKSKRFTHTLFPEDLTYNKVEPYLEIVLQEHRKEKFNKHRQSIKMKSSLIFLEYLYKGRQTDFYYVNTLSYKYDFKRQRDNLWFEVKAKQSTNFLSLSGEMNVQFNYSTKRENAFYIRFFGGGFLYSKFNGNAPITKFLLSSGTNRFNYYGNRYQKDYAFDTYFLDRNAQDSFFSKQVAISDGGFKSVFDIGQSDKYLLALNLKSDIPIPIPIEPWANVAIIDGEEKPNFVAEFGASINLFNGFLLFHFPFLTTKNIKENQEYMGIDNLGKRISFTLDLMKLEKLRNF